MQLLTQLRFLAGIWFRENDHACRVAMQEVTPSDRADLALGKKSSRWDRADPFLHDPDIMMGLPKESLSPSATAEQKGSEWWAVVPEPIRG